MKNQTAALFDLDGVLVDTEGQYSRFWRQVGEQDFPEQPDFAEKIKGRTLVQIYNQYFAGKEERQQCITEALHRFEHEMDFPFIPGALEFVDHLRHEGFKVAVVTSSDQDKLKCLFRCHPDFATHFDRIFTAEDAPRSKPAPDCYIEAARQLGFDSSDCYVFEDSHNGLKAGFDSGAIVVGLATTHPVTDIQPLCHYVMSDFTNFTVAELCNIKR